MGLARSTFYDAPKQAADDTALVEAMAAICDTFEAYGWRRVQAALRQQGPVVNHKKVRRLMREHDLQPRVRRRYVTTIDSDHGGPIFPNLAKDIVPTGPNQLWVADLTYVAVTGGFVYVAIILDAWSRRVVGYALSRSIDVRLTVAALRAAIERRPAPGLTHHTDRGSQGRFKWSSQQPAEGSCDGGSTAFGSGTTGQVEIAGASARGTAGASTPVLGIDRVGSVERGRRDGMRDLTAGGNTLVPRSGRTAALPSLALVAVAL